MAEKGQGGAPKAQPSWLSSALTSVVSTAGAAATAAASQVDSFVKSSHVSNFTPEQVATIKQMFDVGDVRVSGTLDKEELRLCLFKLTQRWLTPSELDTIWREIDTDGSNSVTFDEFLAHAGPLLYPPPAYQIMRAAADQAARVKQYGYDYAEETVMKATDPVIDMVVENVHKAALTSVIDPDMPKLVQSAAKIIIAETIEDLHEELRDMAMKKLKKPYIDRSRPTFVSPLHRGLAGSRAWFLYTLFPYDKSIWAQLKDPWFYVLKALSVFPPPVQPIFFMVLFLVMDHWDEYQLVKYILLFKSSQFLSIGIFSTFVGASYYYQADGGEVLFPMSSLSLALFLAQVTFVWLAFFFLPFSAEKGKSKEVQAMDVPVGTCCGMKRFEGRGGRLAALFYYDVACFVALAIAGIVAYAIDPSKRITMFGDLNILGVTQAQLDALDPSQEDRRLTERLYWARTIYGVCAFPFMIFQLPALGNFLTHTVPTAYGPWGRTHKMLTSAEMMKVREVRQVEAEIRRSQRALDGRGWLPDCVTARRRSGTQAPAEEGGRPAAVAVV